MTGLRSPAGILQPNRNTVINSWMATVMYFCSAVYLTFHQILLHLISATFLPLDEEIASRAIFVIVSGPSRKRWASWTASIQIALCFCPENWPKHAVSEAPRPWRSTPRLSRRRCHRPSSFVESKGDSTLNTNGSFQSHPNCFHRPYD